MPISVNLLSGLIAAGSQPVRSEIKPESKFTEIGIDSLDTVEILMSLEDEVGVELELDQAVETVADLDKFIQSKKG